MPNRPTVWESGCNTTICSLIVWCRHFLQHGLRGLMLCAALAHSAVST